MCSGITRVSVVNGELYAQRFHKLIYLHLITDCFMNFSPQFLESLQSSVFIPMIEEIPIIEEKTL